MEGPAPGNAGFVSFNSLFGRTVAPRVGRLETRPQLRARARVAGRLDRSIHSSAHPRTLLE